MEGHENSISIGTISLRDFIVDDDSVRKQQLEHLQSTARSIRKLHNTARPQHGSSLLGDTGSDPYTLQLTQKVFDNLNYHIDDYVSAYDLEIDLANTLG